MIDNFELIADLIRRKADKDEFYFLQILKRRKDNPGMKRDMIVIETFFIEGAADLLRQKETLIDICEKNNARAYIRLNKRSYKKVAKQFLRMVTDTVVSGNYKNVRNCYHSACGKHHSDKDKKWIIDLDGELVQHIDNVEATIRNLYAQRNEGDPIVARIPTKNGIHVITRPVNLQYFIFSVAKFTEAKIDVHKDNPTLLYCK